MQKQSRHIIFLSLTFTILLTFVFSLSVQTSQAKGMSQSVMLDSGLIIIPGDDVVEGESDFDDTPSAITTPRCSQPTDTLRTYTLSGLRLDGKGKNAASRTLYNIIIKNGRKVLKR